MPRRAQLLFLALVLAQAAHSVEEYVGRLYDVFTPARAVSGLFAQDLAAGFVVANALIVLAGLACWAALVRTVRPAARACAWFWVCLEAANGVGHTLLALDRGGYFPGAGTAPLLLGVSGWLALTLRRGGDGE